MANSEPLRRSSRAGTQMAVENRYGEEVDGEMSLIPDDLLRSLGLDTSLEPVGLTELTPPSTLEALKRVPFGKCVGSEACKTCINIRSLLLSWGVCLCS